MYTKMTESTFHLRKLWCLKLTSLFRASNSSDRDAAFKMAFNSMASSFELPTNDLFQKRKALEITAYTTLYTKFYLPSKKNKESHPSHPA